MPSGEIPVVGDYVKNQWEQPGTMTRVHAARDGKEQISIRWDDGRVYMPLTPAKEFTPKLCTQIALVGAVSFRCHNLF
jgi:hypothetical protein